MRNNVRATASAALLLAVVGQNMAQGQTDDTDAIWHNRYHAIFSMSAYGDYDRLCPQIFTEATMRENFPDISLAPWDLIESFGPTASGAQGYTVQLPEMDKVVLVFRGNYTIETSLDQEVTSLDEALGLGGVCANCTVNAHAMRAYLEAREATNNWALSRQRMEETGLEYSITGHGFGGMLSLIASIDLGWAGDCRWSHNYGTPRTFNQAGVDMYTRLFSGVAGERGVANGDPFPEIIPAGPNYAHTGTAFYYHGHSNVTHMNMVVCRDQPESPECRPREPLNEVDHYFYFSNVRQCGQGRWREDRQANAAFIAAQEGTMPSINATRNATAPDAGSANSTALGTSGSNAIFANLSGLRDTLTAFLNGASDE